MVPKDADQMTNSVDLVRLEQQFDLDLHSQICPSESFGSLQKVNKFFVHQRVAIKHKNLNVFFKLRQKNNVSFPETLPTLLFWGLL